MKRRLGGSDIAKLLGLSPYGGPLDVYERVVLGKEEPWNPRMERGAMFEPVLRAHAQRHLGVEVEDAASDYHEHPTLEFARAQVDDVARWNGVPVVVDYKTSNRFAKGWGREGTDEVPEHLRCQFAWEMLATDRELALVIVGFGEDRPGPEVFCMSNVVVYQVQRDPLFESLCVAVAREFWQRHVLAQTPPPATAKKRRRSC